MLKILRKKGVMKKVIWTIVIIIIIAFGLGGTAYLFNDSGSDAYAGKLFGKKVSLDDYEKAYRDVRIQAVLRYGDNFKNIQQFLNLDMETWDRLILSHEVKKRKIKVLDKEVIEQISAYPFFQRENQFDTSLYNNILQYALRIKPREFEETTRDTLKFRKLFEQKTAHVIVPEKDVFDAYKTKNEKTQISYVFISPDQFKKDISVSEENIQKYYEENKLEFLLPASINVDYISLNFPKPSQVEIPKKDSADEEPVLPQINEEEKEKIREQIAVISDDLFISSNLQETAEKHNLKVKSSGFFSMEQPNLSLGWSYEFLNKILQMKTGEISNSFETATAIHIVQIKEKKETFVPEYVEAHEKVKEAVVNNESQKIAEKNARQYLLAINQEINKTKLKDFPKAAKTLGLEIYQTPIFTRGQYLPKIGIAKDFEEAAFQLNEKNPISGIVGTEKGFCILHLDKYIPIEQEDFAKKKEALTEELLSEFKNKFFNEFLIQLRMEAKLIDYIAKMKADREARN